MLPSDSRTLSPDLLREVVRISVEKTDLTIRTPDVLEFVLAARESLGSLNYKNIRTFGPLAGTEVARGLGLRANTKLGFGFLGILNEKGLADILDAANVIAQTVEAGIYSARGILRSRDNGFSQLRFRCSSMAAGPCHLALRLDGAAIRVEDAALLPFADCDKLGQCGCSYRSELTFE